jgi:hypothetical protein
MSDQLDNAKYTYNTPEWWEAQIKRGLAQRAKWGFEDRWVDIKKYYENRWANQLEPRFNLIYMFGASMIPALVFQAPSIINTARRPEFNYWANFFDSIDNWWVGESEMKSVMEDAVLSGFLYNCAAIQLGYDFPDDKMTVEKESDLQFLPLKGVVDRSRKTNLPWLDLIPPDKLVLAPGTKNIRNCPWFAKLCMVPTRLLKKRKGFTNVTTTHMPQEVGNKEQNKFLEEQGAIEPYTCYYEVHDAEAGKYFCIDTNWKIIQKPEDDFTQVDGLPLEILTFNKGAETIWGTPDSLYIESQMLEGNECRRDGRLQRRMALVKGFYKNGVISKEDLEKFLSGDPMTMIGLEFNSDQAIGEVIQLAQPHVQMEYFEYQKQLQTDAQSLIGFGPNQSGSFSPGRRTKFEAQVVEDRSLLRTTIRRQRVADIIGSLTEKTNQLITKYWKAPTIQKVVGVDGAMHWVQAKPSEFKEIQAQLCTKVNVDSLTPVSRERRKEEMMNMIGLLTKVQGADTMPIIKSLLGQFDWGQATEVLPTANGGPVGMDQFAQQQNQAMQSSTNGQTASQNMQGMSKLVNNLPQG